MADLIESARAILSNSERRMEATANNVANLTTPAFKTTHLYSEVSMGADLSAPKTSLSTQVDLAQGRLSSTGNALDIAISGPGMFRLRGADGIHYSRQGQFKLGPDGRVTNLQGLALQTADGGDLVLESADVKVLPDGLVVAGDRPVAKIGVYQSATGGEIGSNGASLFTIAEHLVEEVPAPQLRQGMVEGSNVALADEMVSMMDSLRQAEGGARLVQTYDDLMARAITTLGQGAR
jgi:flagellar basal-body rod protein FlgG